MLFTQFILVTGLLLASTWQVPIAWLLSFFLLHPFLAMMRQTLEHRALDADKNLYYQKFDTAPSIECLVPDGLPPVWCGWI